jgi:hypothetical protein
VAFPFERAKRRIGPQEVDAATTPIGLCSAEGDWSVPGVTTSAGTSGTRGPG